MKKLRILIVACIVSCSLFLVAGSAMAASTAWVITDTQNDNAYASLTRKSSFDTGEGFAIYAYNNLDSAITLLDSTIVSADLYYNKDNNTLKVTGSDEEDRETVLGTLQLNSGGQFAFYFFDSNSNKYDISYTLGTGKYVLTDGSGNMSQRIDLHDAAPVPIPASVILFGTGLLGLVGLKRRKTEV